MQDPPPNVSVTLDVPWAVVTARDFFNGADDLCGHNPALGETIASALGMLHHGDPRRLLPTLAEAIVSIADTVSRRPLTREETAFADAARALLGIENLDPGAEP